MADSLYVVIPTTGRQSLLEKTLYSLLECKKPEIYKGTIVIENGPDPQSEAIVKKFKDTIKAKYLYHSRPNKSNALNIAISGLPDEALVFFSDDDVRLHPDILMAYAAAFTPFCSGRYGGGKVSIDYEAPPADWLKPYLPNSVRGWDPAELSRSKKIKSFMGINWAAFIGDIKAHGGFNDAFGPGSTTGATGQETEMQRKLFKGNVEPVTVVNAEVWHYVPRNRCSVEWIKKRQRRQGINHILKNQKLQSGRLY